MEVQDEQCRCKEWGAGETSSARRGREANFGGKEDGSEGGGSPYYSRGINRKGKGEGDGAETETLQL
jgi:hypothetical protein